jgi:hypothetical protein
MAQELAAKYQVPSAQAVVAVEGPCTYQCCCSFMLRCDPGDRW